MEELRIREKNIIYIRIKDLTTYIANNDAKITRLNNQTMDSFNISQIKKAQANNQTYKTELDELKEKVINITNGKLDNELKVSTQTNKDIINKKTEEKKIKKTEEKTIQKTKEKTNLQISYTMSRNRNNGEASDWVLNKETSNFFRTINGIPDYMLRNLKEMPNNKGYIWKGVWCLGELPAEVNQPLILFEKLRNDVMRIHEIDSDHVKVYEKQGKHSKRFLISNDVRNKKLR